MTFDLDIGKDCRVLNTFAVLKAGSRISWINKTLFVCSPTAFSKDIRDRFLRHWHWNTVIFELCRYVLFHVDETAKLLGKGKLWANASIKTWSSSVPKARTSWSFFSKQIIVLKDTKCFLWCMRMGPSIVGCFCNVMLTSIRCLYVELTQVLCCICSQDTE